MASQKSHDGKGLLVSAIIHAGLLIFLYFFVLHTPDPPLGGGSGVVLNLGFVDEGTGELQTMNEANPSTNPEENKPQEPTPQPVESEENNTDEGKTQDESLLTGTEESEVAVDPQQKPQEIKGQEKPIATSQEPIKTNPTTTQTNNAGKIGTGTQGGNNNGDKQGKIGDQGNPNGQVDSKALYGNAGSGGSGQGGSGGGASLDMAGWMWDKRPKINDDSEDAGVIEYQVTIDDQGDIIDVKTLRSSVSPAVEKIYRKEVERITFSKTDNKVPALKSIGKITFIIRSR